MRLPVSMRGVAAPGGTADLREDWEERLAGGLFCKGLALRQVL